MIKRGLIIFIKNPELGKAKTRLAATVGDEKALEVYQDLLAHTRKIALAVDADRLLFYSDSITQNDEWSLDHFKKYLQSKGDLGEKLKQAFAQGFESDYDQLLVIGSDCPVLTAEQIEKAFAELTKTEGSTASKVGIGPSKDGGYYLLGMRKYYYHLFENKPWSTDKLLESTVTELEERKVRFSLLEELYDIDTEEDLKKWTASA